jgi:hypothetical protein
MRRHLVLLSLAFAVAATLLVAPAGATAPAAKNGCKYLKISEVNKITGLTFAKGETPPGPPAAAVCGYAVVGDQAKSVNVWVQPKPQTALAFKTAKEAFAESAEPVTGLGKKAFYAGGGINTAYVLNGGTLVFVQYISPGNPDDAAIKDAVVKMTKVVNRRV